MIRVLGVAGLLAILVMALLGDRHPMEAGVAAPAISARTLSGQPISVDTAIGKPIVVNFWATWCPPCMQELPEFRQAANAYGERVKFYGLATTDSPKELIARLDIPYEVLHVGGATSRAWQASALPSTYIIDGNGKIAWSVRGSIDRETLEKHLEPLLR